jgi:hypothetical protein
MKTEDQLTRELRNLELDAPEPSLTDKNYNTLAEEVRALKRLLCDLGFERTIGQ